MDCSMGIRCSKGRAWNMGSSGRKSAEYRGGEMTTLPIRVPGYTTNLTTLKVVDVPKLGWWSGMLEVVMPEIVVVVPELTR